MHLIVVSKITISSSFRIKLQIAWERAVEVVILALSVSGRYFA